MRVMADHTKVIAILVIPWVTAFNVVDFLLQLDFSGCIICLHCQHFRVIRRIGSSGENGTDALRHHGAGGHGIHQHTGNEEQNPCHQETLLVAHDECPCLLCLFFYRPCGFSCFGCSLGGISSSLTGMFGGGILLFDGLLLLPAGKRIAGKLGIFLQRFLVQNIYICLFQLTLCLGCFAVRLQLVAAIALPHQISAGLHRFLGLVGAFHAHIVLFCFPDLFVELARNQMDGSFPDSLRNFGRWLFLVLKGQLRGLFSGIRVDDRLPDLFLWDIGLRLICSGRSFLRFTDRLFQCRVRPFLISKAQARLLIQTILPA